MGVDRKKTGMRSSQGRGVAASPSKIDPYDPTEDLPANWEKIPEVATQVYAAYRTLIEARSRRGRDD